MENTHDDDRKALAEAVTSVREFVVQQLRAGHRADELSFALTFIATEVGLHLMHGRNPLGVVRTVLQGVIAAASTSTVEERSEASAGAETMPGRDADPVPEGTVIH